MSVHPQRNVPFYCHRCRASTIPAWRIIGPDASGALHGYWWCSNRHNYPNGPINDSADLAWKLSLGGLLCGFPLSIAGLLLGVVALRQPAHRGRAIFAICLGAACLFLWGYVLFG